MSQTTVSIRMDNELKNNFDHICTELGRVVNADIDSRFDTGADGDRLY